MPHKEHLEIVHMGGTWPSYVGHVLKMSLSVSFPGCTLHAARVAEMPQLSHQVEVFNC